MSNGHVCCLYGVCCPPGSAKQKDALAKELIHHDIVSDEADAERIATWLLATFDLAPVGSLKQFKADIAKMARAKPSEE